MTVSFESRPLLICAATFGLAAVVTALLTVILRNVARQHRWLCKHPTQRDIHTDAIPRIGGAAICLALLVTVVIFRKSAIQLSMEDMGPAGLAFLLVPGLLVCGIGLVDDIYGLSASHKFFAQSLAATGLFLGGYKVYSLSLLGVHQFGTIASLVLTIFWVLLVTNSFNLIDGVDGLSAGTAWISVMVLFVAAAMTGQHVISFLAVTLAGAIVGFLPFNFNPATVFLGDSGSLFVGFMLSALSLAGTEKAVVALAVPLVSFALPLSDTGLAVVRRYLNGKPLFSADRDHIHHKLLQKGLSQRQVVLLLYGASAVFGFLSLALLRPTNGTLVLVIISAAMLVTLGIGRLDYPELAELGLATRRTIRQKQTITSNLALRRAIADLADANTLSEICDKLDEACKQSDFDSFEMTVNGASTVGNLGDVNGRHWRHELDDIHFTCSKYPTVVRPWNPSAGWAVRLDLVTADRHRGTFVAYRSYEARTLTLEMNLLVADFRIALASAVDRAVRVSGMDAQPATAVPMRRVAGQQLRGPVPPSRRSVHE